MFNVNITDAMSRAQNKLYEATESARQAYNNMYVDPSQPQPQPQPQQQDPSRTGTVLNIKSTRSGSRAPSPSPSSQNQAQPQAQQPQAQQPQPPQRAPQAESSLISMSPPAPAPDNTALPSHDFMDLNPNRQQQQPQPQPHNQATADLFAFADTPTPAPGNGNGNNNGNASLLGMMDMHISNQPTQPQQTSHTQPQPQQQSHQPPQQHSSAPPPPARANRPQNQPQNGNDPHTSSGSSSAPQQEMDLLGGMGFSQAPQKPARQHSDEHEKATQSRASDPFADWMNPNAGKTTDNRNSTATNKSEPTSTGARSSQAMHDLLGPASSSQPKPAPVQRQQSHDDMINMSGTGTTASSSTGSSSDTLVDISLGELHVEKKVGTGAFAEVFLCIFRGTPVAVKQVLAERRTPAIVADFKREVILLSKLRHPNIMMYIGSHIPESIGNGQTYVVSEYCHNGTLFSLLHESNTALDASRKVQMALDIARGIAFLHGHNPPILHRDIKSLNVLVDKHYSCKISDFGLAMASTGVMTQKCGTYQFMAPELFSGKQHYNEKVDVYAFGVLLWEITTRELPYSGMLGEQVPVAVERGHRPTIPEDCPSFLSNIITQCWNQDPFARPNMIDVVNTLHQVNNRMSQNFRGI